MTDYLNMPDDSAGDGGYLGLDEPAMPTSAPAPPSDPYASNAGGSGGGDFLSPDPYAAAPAQEASYLDGGAGDGGYFGEQSAPAADPYSGGYAEPADQGYGPGPIISNPPMQAAPMAPHGMAGELSVQAPVLDELPAGQQISGGGRGELSSLVLDVEVPVEVFFGDASLTVENFLEMGPGSVVELEHSIEAPIELRVRGRLVAYGQLVTINDNYGLRITRMVGEGNN